MVVLVEELVAARQGQHLVVMEPQDKVLMVEMLLREILAIQVLVVVARVKTEKILAVLMMLAQEEMA
tara:strand:- start:202 stop:402 length:201 start_codon:yes stop_codon:yes gene_type:complete